MVYNILEKSALTYLKMLLFAIIAIILIFLLQLSTMYFLDPAYDIRGVLLRLRDLYLSHKLFFSFQYGLVMLPFVFISYPLLIVDSHDYGSKKALAGAIAIQLVMGLMLLTACISVLYVVQGRIQVNTSALQQKNTMLFETKQPYPHHQVPDTQVRIRPEKENRTGVPRPNSSRNHIFRIFIRIYDFYTNFRYPAFKLPLLGLLFCLYFCIISLFRYYRREDAQYQRVFNFTLLAVLNILFYSSVYYII